MDDGRAKLLARTGLDWSHRYRRTIDALRSLPVKAAYLDGELCALRPDGVPAFSRLQAAMDEGRTDERHSLSVSEKSACEACSSVMCAGSVSVTMLSATALGFASKLAR